MGHQDTKDMDHLSLLEKTCLLNVDPIVLVVLELIVSISYNFDFF